jgi:hypothetical protein
MTGESSPYYMFHPLAVERLASTLPDAKLILLLRNPVDRAYSHYLHERRLGTEPLSFEEAIAREDERLDGEVEKIRSNRNYHSVNHQRYSYVARGRYADQLRNIFAFFPESQVLVLKSEDLYADPSATYGKVLDFLGLRGWDLEGYPQHYASNSSRAEMPKTLRRRLLDYFRPHNQELARYLNLELAWNE